MEYKIIEYLDYYFQFLFIDFGFEKIVEICDEERFEIVYTSDTIKLEIEKYWRELYFQVGLSTSEEMANLYNILEFMNQNTEETVEINYYREIEDLNECYKMQIKLISKVLKENYYKILEFFDEENYARNCIELTEFVIRRNSELFKRIK